MLAIYRFESNDRTGDLSGLFTRDVDYVTEVLARDPEDRLAYFGEVLGKHSDVQIYIEPDEVTLVSDKPEDVEWFNRVLGYGSGYDPFDYLPESNDEYIPDIEDED